MTFAELLREYMDGIPVKRVIEQCEARGKKIDRTFLSKIRHGYRLPPDDPDLLRVIAEVCGRDPEPLIRAAEIERNPAGVLRQVATLLGPLLQEFVGEDDETEDELITRLAKVANIPREALRMSVQALKATR